MSIHEIIDKGYRKALGLGSDVPQEPDDSGAEYILTALEAAGYVIVPKEPTKEMLDRAMRKLDPGNENYVTREDLIEAYRTMIETRPK